MEHKSPDVPFDLEQMSDSDYNALLALPFDWRNALIDVERISRDVDLKSPSYWQTHWPQPFVSIGIFNTLPNELLFLLFEKIDLRGLMKLRATNRYMKRMIEICPVFRHIMEYAIEAVKVMLVTGAATYWSAKHLERVLHLSRCELCGEHGEFLQLLKMVRCCFRCLSIHQYLHALSPRNAKYNAHIAVEKENLGKIPYLNIPKQSSFWSEETTMRMRLWDYTTAVKWSGQAIDHMPSLLRKRQQRNHAIAHQSLMSNALPDEADNSRPSSYLSRGADIDERTIQMLSSLDIGTGPDVVQTDNSRLLAAMQFPAMRKSHPLPPPTSRSLKASYVIEKQPQWVQVNAYYCVGCRWAWNFVGFWHFATHTLYAEGQEITDHLRYCPYARMWWWGLYPRDRPVDQIEAARLFAPLPRTRRGGVVPRFPHHSEAKHKALSRFHRVAIHIPQFYESFRKSYCYRYRKEFTIGPSVYDEIERSGEFFIRQTAAHDPDPDTKSHKAFESWLRRNNPREGLFWDLNR